MAEAIRRTRPAAAAPARRSAAVGGRRSTAGGGVHRGEEGMRRVDEEIAKAKERAELRKTQGKMPFRFRLAVGESRQMVIVDDKPDFYRYEHNSQDSDGRWNIFNGCVKESANCPACTVLKKESYYAMYLTVIDLTPFENKQGEEVPFSRKLLVVKNQQQKKFLRLYEKEGTLRGAVFECHRDGEKEPAIGSDISFVEWMPEDELVTYTREFKDREGKRHVEDCSEPYDYEALFPPATEDELRAVFGGEPSPGSRAANRSALGARGATARRSSKVEDDWEDPEANEGFDDDEQAAPARRGAAPARRGASRPTVAPATRGVARRRPVVEEAEDVVEEDDAVEETEAARPASRRGVAAPARRRPAPPAEEEVDDDVEAAPAPRRVSMRGRR